MGDGGAQEKVVGYDSKGFGKFRSAQMEDYCRGSGYKRSRIVAKTLTEL